MVQKTTGIRAILSLAPAYKLLQNILGSEKSRKELVERYIRPELALSILDVGCGPANILNYLPEGIQYTGIDLSEEYIRDARKRHGHRGTFHCLPLGEMDVGQYGEFDLVMATGVLHHLSDDEGRKLFTDAAKCLKPGGRVLTVDPVFAAGQHPFARWMASMDRGQNVRNPEGYTSLIDQRAFDVGFEVRHDRLKVPYSHMMITATKTITGSNA